MDYPVNNKTSLFSGHLFLWITLFVSLLMSLFAMNAAFFSDQPFDQRIFDWLAPHINAGRTRFMSFISFGGNTYFLVPANLLLLFYFIIKKNKWWAVRVATVSLSSLGLMSLLKNSIQRHRPADPLVDGITNYSFPSGHAFMSVAFYGLLAYWAATEIKKGLLQRMLIIFCIIFIMAIGFTRIYLRVHYASDVLAGLGMGTAWLILSLAIIDKIKKGYFEKRK